MIKNRINKHTLVILMAICAAFVSCNSSEDFSPDVETGVEPEIICEVADKDYVEDGSRSSLKFATNKMQFKWLADDGITVFAHGDNTAAQLFKLTNGADQPMAEFKSENFSLTANKLYYAFSKVKGEDTNVKIANQNDITVDYSGQTQIGNAGDDHLGAYDFMAAGAVPSSASSVHFAFKHLGATLRIVMAFDPENVTNPDEKAALKLEADGAELKMPRFTELELFDKKNTFRQTERFFTFETGTRDDGNGNYSYEFAQPAQTIDKTDRFKLKLVSKTHPDEGITRMDPFLDGSGTNNKKIIAYMELPPHAFADDSKINVMLRGYYEKKVNNVWTKFPISYTQEYANSLTITAGKAHQISFTMKKPEVFDVTLNVNHNWQHGDVVDNSVSSARSRATTGDPGVDDQIQTPRYIHYIYCHGGKVVMPSREGGATVVTTIDASHTTDWDTHVVNKEYISTYKGGATAGIISLVKYKSGDGDHPAHTGDCTHHLYVVASNTDLSTTLPTINVGDSEETLIRELKYNIPNTDAQVFMRDLYSTPWDATNFEGNLVDAVQDITLYHVAANVDVKWNSETTPIESVKVSDVKKENLYIFQPTENIYEAGTYTETKTITAEDQKYLGRWQFYLPQFKAPNSKYNVGFNSEATTTVTFTPDVTGGYTSWLRWLKMKN